MLEMFSQSPQIDCTVAALLSASLPAASAADGSLCSRHVNDVAIRFEDHVIPLFCKHLKYE
jgi:hypothetical protein